jgi:hypothetical protein
MVFNNTGKKFFDEIKKGLLCLPDVLVDLVISLSSYDDEVDRQCSKLDCLNPISRKAFLKFNCRECIKCRRYIVTRDICGYRYDDGYICREKNLEYHMHCDNYGCDGAIYCETCSKCPICDPRH